MEMEWQKNRDMFWEKQLNNLGFEKIVKGNSYLLYRIVQNFVMIIFFPPKLYRKYILTIQFSGVFISIHSMSKYEILYGYYCLLVPENVYDSFSIHICYTSSLVLYQVPYLCSKLEKNLNHQTECKG